MSIADTSRAAYLKLEPELAGRRADVFRAIAEAGVVGIAQFEVAQKLGMKDNWVSGRITELLEAGLVVDSGRRKVNPLTKNTVRIVVATAATCDANGQLRFVA